MHKEPIFKSALTVTFFWVAVWYAFHPGDLGALWREVGNIPVALAGLSAIGVLGGLLSFWLSSEVVDERIRRLEPAPRSGIIPSIGVTPLHKIELPIESTDYDAKNPRASLSAAFKTLRESPLLVPLDQRRIAPVGDEPGRFDAVDLDQIESVVLASSDAHVALFDKVLRALMRKPDLLTTYEKEGHGRHNGMGGRTLLQHSLLVCQKCIDIAPNTKFDGIHGRERVEKKLRTGQTAVYYKQTAEIMFGVRQRAIESFKGDPLVPLIGLAHDIGKIECYEWRPGESEPYALRPNHDLVGAHILSRMPETWGLPNQRVGNTLVEDDREILIGAIAFYHHPSEQPMDWIHGTKPGEMVPQIRSDRMIGLMELLIRADRMTGAIENNADPQDVQEAAVLEQADEADTFIIIKEDENSLLWDAVEAILMEPDRINAALERGQPSARSVGFVVEAPDWSANPVLALIETQFTAAVVNRADIPPARKEMLLAKNSDNKNAAMIGTRAILSLLAKHGALIKPPAQPDYAPESSVWQVQFFKPENVYERGDYHGNRFPQPSGDPQFQPGDMILCDPTTLFPSVAGTPPYGYAIHCVGNRLGGAGQIRGNGKKGISAPKDRVSNLDQAAQRMDAGLPQAQAEPSQGKKRRPPISAQVRPPEPGSEADLFISQLKLMLDNQMVHIEPEPEDGWYRVTEQYERIIEMLGIRQHIDAIARSVGRMDSAGIALRECDDSQGNPCRIVLADARWVVGNPPEPQEQAPAREGNPVPEESASTDQVPDAPPAAMADTAQPAAQSEDEDPTLIFQKRLATWLDKNAQMLRGPKERAGRAEFGIVVPFETLAQDLGIEPMLIDLAESPVPDDFQEDFYITTTKGDPPVRILVVSDDWLDRREIARPGAAAAPSETDK
jgi:hypothetical protein